MKKLLTRRSFRNNLLFLVVFGVVLYATGYHVRIYSGLKNTLIRTGIITPGAVDVADFEQQRLAPGALDGLQLVGEDGRLVRLGDFGEEVILINTWASWCPPCVAEMPGLNALYESEKSTVGFVMLTWDRTMEAAQAYRDRNGYSFPVHKAAGKVPDPIKAGSIPTTFLLDKKDNTLYRHAGMIAFDTPEMRDLLTRLKQK